MAIRDVPQGDALVARSALLLHIIMVPRAFSHRVVTRRRRNFSIDTRIRDCTDIRSDLMAGTMAKNAICDALRDARGEKPDPPEDTADVPLFLTLYRDKAILYRDMSGARGVERCSNRERVESNRGESHKGFPASHIEIRQRQLRGRCPSLPLSSLLNLQPPPPPAPYPVP